jgi:invasion protein IalB
LHRKPYRGKSPVTLGREMLVKRMVLIGATAALAVFAVTAQAQPVGGAAPSQLTTPATQGSSPPVTPAGPPGSTTTTRSTAPDQQVICKHIEEIGTRLGGKRVCMTKAQWAQQAQDARDATDGAQRAPH